MRPSGLDQRVRLTFAWLDVQRENHGEVLPWALLLEGFEYDGRRVPLLSQQGIFKPRLCDLPLSIRTSSEGPYKDELRSDGTLRYAYRGGARRLRAALLDHRREGVAGPRGGAHQAVRPGRRAPRGQRPAAAQRHPELFDRGYLTVTPDRILAVSRWIREDWQNGRDSCALRGQPIREPARGYPAPSREFLEWHNQSRFLG